MDQGVISTFKVIYRRELIKKIIDSESPLKDNLKAINIKEMIHLAGQSWESVTAKCIDRCLVKGLGTAFPLPIADETRGDNEDSDEEFEGFT